MSDTQQPQAQPLLDSVVPAVVPVAPTVPVVLAVSRDVQLMARIDELPQELMELIFAQLPFARLAVLSEGE